MRDGQEFLLCRGGEGGKGNVHFKSSRNRAPRQYTDGEEGEHGDFLLELRTIADAGLVGYPNAGKSTLLRKLSAARPKVAPYPFTTLHPVVGVMELPGYRHATIADIPGLIEGAHRGLGLGHEFLRHITRCPILIFVIDVAGSEGRSPVEDLQNLRKEIDLYDPTLSSRPWLVVANKMDLPNANENLEMLREKFPKTSIVPISAANGEGIDMLKEALAERMTDDQDILVGHLRRSPSVRRRAPVSDSRVTLDEEGSRRMPNAVGAASGRSVLGSPASRGSLALGEAADHVLLHVRRDEAAVLLKTLARPYPRPRPA